ncbi:hypothetical protein [Nonomuraea antimicrobica]|uniref:hypothetical protein n=1 Tax=Nonomuraea antimicrobica TaxID=561173 RepID=UPI0031EE7C19
MGSGSDPVSRAASSRCAAAVTVRASETASGVPAFTRSSVSRRAASFPCKAATSSSRSSR